MNNPTESGQAGGRRILGARRTSLPGIAEKPASIVSLDSPAVWVDTPQVAQQLGKKGMFKLDKVEVKIFDLAEPAQLIAYSKLLSDVTAEDTNMYLAGNERVFCRGTQNWKALVQIQYVKFRQVFQKKLLGEVPEEISHTA